MAKTLESSINLKLLSAYWCHEVVHEHADRFDWAYDQLYELTHEISEASIQTLLALAMTAPSEQTGADFAAGPLEDYINLIVEHQLNHEAAFIVDNIFLKPYLPDVWGKITELKTLAEQGDPTKAYVALPNIENGLMTLSSKAVMGFWCHASVTSVVTEYQKYYDEVLKQLFNKNLRDKVISDLLLTAPDARAVTYLKENVLVLRK